MKKSKVNSIYVVIIPIIVMIFNLFVIFYPNEIIKASFDGLYLWFNVVLPSLLPFIIGANILTNLGFVEFLGILIEPIMRIMFNVSGKGGFPFISGITSGYPIGAKIIGNLRSNESISKVEGQRLLGFCNNSGPLFIIGSVGVGMFKNAEVGYFLLITHYISAITNGIIFKFYGDLENNYSGNSKKLGAVLDDMGKNYKTFGEVLAKSVSNAMESLIQVGGYIILFCVITEILDLINFFGYTANIISNIVNVDNNVIKGYLIGIMEMTNGAKVIAEIDISLQVLLAMAFILSFGGFSVHAQSINFISKTDLNIFIYLLGKLSHGILALLWGIAIYPFFDFTKGTIETVETFSLFNLDVVSEGNILNRFTFSAFGIIIIATLIVANYIFPFGRNRNRKKGKYLYKPVYRKRNKKYY